MHTDEHGLNAQCNRGFSSANLCVLRGNTLFEFNLTAEDAEGRGGGKKVN